jgi:outer membrane lipoprotein-sorting protein
MMRGFLLLAVLLATSAQAQVPPPVPAAPAPVDAAALAQRIVDDVEARMRGKASVGTLEMIIERYHRTLRMDFQEVFPDRSLVRITAPAEDAGVASLKRGHDLWTYNPRIDQVQKVPPALMLDAWMGSEFTNDDVSRGSSLKLDYEVGRAEAATRDGTATWRLSLTPRPDSPVVWERLVIEVAKDDLRPLAEEYYDEKGALARVLLFKDFRPMADGRLYPFTWRMENRQEAGRATEIRVQAMEFKDTLPDAVFSQRGLKKAR